MILKALFWASLAAIVWTHLGYPLFAALIARLRERPVRKAPIEPSVAVIVAAHNEEDVIERRLENLLELDYPPDKLEVVVASDASTDRTDAIVEEIASRDTRVRLIRCPRAGKVAAQNRGVRETNGEILAFSDANATWAPDALRRLLASFADPEVAYVFGQHRYETAEGTNRESAYWRYEVWLRAQESRIGSTTGGYGSIYAVRRADYVEVDPRFGHDLAFPYLMVQRWRRAVYEPAALAYEKPARDQEDEYRRKVRMFEHCWLIVARGRMLRGIPPLYWIATVSHRLLRYSSGILHLVLLGASVALAGEGLVYQVILGAQLAFLVLAALGRLRLPVPGAALAYYYVLVTWATVVALVRYLRVGVPAVWEKAEGTR